MPLQTVKCIQQSKAESLQPRDDTAMISITDPLHAPADLRPGWNALLRCSFLDAEYNELDIIFWKERWASIRQDRPNAEHANQVLDFLKEIAQSETIKHLVIHCSAGGSRSATVAQYAAQRYGLPFDDHDAFNGTLYTLLIQPEYYKQFEEKLLCIQGCDDAVPERANQGG